MGLAYCKQVKIKLTHQPLLFAQLMNTTVRTSNTHGKYIARDEDTPFVRFGFPIADRPSHNFFAKTGYDGAANLVIQIMDAFLDYTDRNAVEEKFEFQF